MVIFMAHWRIGKITHGKSVTHVSYLDLRLRQPSYRRKRLLDFDIRILCDREGPLQLAQLRLAESCALPATLGVRAHLVGSIMAYYKERTKC